MRSTAEGRPNKNRWRLVGMFLRRGIQVARMSIRMLAVELYRVMKEVEELEKRLESLKPGALGTEEIEERLRTARAERARLKKMVEGAKDS